MPQADITIPVSYSVDCAPEAFTEQQMNSKEYCRYCARSLSPLFSKSSKFLQNHAYSTAAIFHSRGRCVQEIDAHVGVDSSSGLSGWRVPHNLTYIIYYHHQEFTLIVKSTVNAQRSALIHATKDKVPLKIGASPAVRTYFPSIHLPVLSPLSLAVFSAEARLQFKFHFYSNASSPPIPTHNLPHCSKVDWVEIRVTAYFTMKNHKFYSGSNAHGGSTTPVRTH